MALVAGVPERGEAVVAAMERRMARVRQHRGPEAAQHHHDHRTPGNGLMLVARDGTYTGDAIVRAGGRFGLVGTATIAQVSPEAILNADPDVLLFAGSEKGPQGTDRPAGLGRDACRAHRTRACGQSYELLIPGPRTIDGIEHLAAFLPSDGAGPMKVWLLLGLALFFAILLAACAGHDRASRAICCEPSRAIARCAAGCCSNGGSPGCWRRASSVRCLGWAA